MLVATTASMALVVATEETVPSEAKASIGTPETSAKPISIPLPTVEEIAKKVGEAYASLDSLAFEATLEISYVQTPQLAEGQVREMLNPRVAVATLPGVITSHVSISADMGRKSFSTKMRKTSADKPQLILSLKDGECTETNWYDTPGQVGYFSDSYPAPDPHGFGDVNLKTQPCLTDEIPAAVCAIGQFHNTWLDRSSQAKAFMDTIGRTSVVTLETLDGKEVYHVATQDEGSEGKMRGSARRSWTVRNDHMYIDTKTFLILRWEIERTNDVRWPEPPYTPWQNYLFDRYSYKYSHLVPTQTMEVTARKTD